MPQIHLLTTGKHKDAAALSLCAEYTKRLTPYTTVELTELPQSKASAPETIKKEEAFQQLERLKKLPQNTVIIALDERGKLFSTVEFANKLQKWQLEGNSSFCFIIGGAEGLDESIRQKAHLVWSLSPLTFPHLLVRPLLLEQVYRSFTWLAGHPYHRA